MGYMFAEVGPGIAGVYMSAVFGASLSTCSSTINSFSVIVVEDILKPYFKIGKHTISWISKAAMVFSGALIIAFAYSFRNGSGLAEACTAVLSGKFLNLLSVDNSRYMTSCLKL